MKKKYFKKSLALIMTVLMIMSCWVFVAPTEAEAAALEAASSLYNKSLLNGINTNVDYGVNTTGNYYKFKIYGTGDDGSANTTARQQKYYKNILSHDGDSALKGDNNRGSYFSNVTNSELTVSIAYPTMVLKYDGVTTPKFGIMLEADSSSGKTVRFERAWMDANSNGLSFNPNYWLGIANDDSAYFYCMDDADHKYTLRAQDVNQGGVFNARSNGQWEFLAASLEFTGSMSMGEWVRTISPTWKFSNGSTTYTGTNTSTIYVMNFKGYGELLTQINNKKTELLNNAAQYTPASIEAFVNAAKAIINLNPKNYTAINQATSWGSQMNTAYANYNTAVNGLTNRKFDIQAENLFSFADWANSTSVAYTVDIDKGTLYITAGSNNAEVVTSHSGNSTRDTGKYAIEVEANTQYTLEWTTSSTQNADKVGSEMFAFFYDINNKAFSTWANYSGHGSSNGTSKYTFTTPENAKYMEVRFDLNNNGYASNMTFSDVKLYKTSRAEEIGFADWTSGRNIRKVYAYNASVGTLDTPVRPGYDFGGWTNADGSAFTGATMTSSRVVYSTWTKSTLDVGYDNLFSLANWAATNSNKVNSNGTDLKVDLEAGTIAVTGSSDAYTTYGGGSDQYHIPVTAGETYVFDYDATSTNGTYQQFIFFYDATGSGVTGALDNGTATTNTHIGKYDGKPITFTVPSGCTQIGLRLGICGSESGTATYSNIGIYKKADYDAYAKDYAKVREPFKLGDTDELMNPSRDGYVFDGWELADRTPITSVEGLTESTTVYATWTKLWTVTFYNGDGTVLFTTQVKDGEAATLPTVTPTKASDDNYSYEFAGWDKTLTSITADTKTKPTFTSNAHTVAYTLVSNRTCTANAIVDKYCSACGYDFFTSQEYDGTEIDAYLKLNHDFVNQSAVLNSSDGEDGTHEVRCSRYNTAKCGGTIRVEHVFSQGTTEGANCSTQGTINWSCPCGQTKTTTGAYAPDVHVNTRTINAKDPECLEDGYTGDTYCDDCKKIVAYGKAIDQLGHSFTNYVYNNDAECEKDGTETAKCDRCDVTDTQTATGTAKEHNWTDTEKYLKSAANCTENEVYYKECSLCGISSESKTGATWTKADTAWNHKFDGAYVTNNNGTHVQKCTNTGCIATGNEKACTYGAWTTDNTVTHSHTCTACGYTPAAENHSWSKWTTVEGATDTAAAKQTRSCTVCGRVETNDCVYASTHYDETCTTPERTEYKCSDCGHGYTVIGNDAKGHNFSGEVKTYNNGYHNYLCVNGCGNYGFEGLVNARENCSYGYTNTASGTHKVDCTVCEYSYSDDCSGGQATCTAEAVCEKCNTAYGNKADHSFNGAAVKLEGDVHAFLCVFCGTTTGIYGVENRVNGTKDCTGGTATCSALAVCDICADTHGELDADAHKWSLPPVADTANAGKHIYTCEYNNVHTKSEACESGSFEVIAPKCEEEGYTIQTCKDCSYKWNTDYVDPTGHKWGDLVSGNDGTHTYTCQNGAGCTKTKTENCEDWKMVSGVASSTCTEQGFTLYECDVCGYSWKDDYTDATGHSYVNKVKVLDEVYKRSEKTCTAAETYWYRCDNCNVSAETEKDKYAENLESIYWVNGSPAGHKMEDLVDENDLAKNRKTEATCTYPAVYYKSCSVCGEQDTVNTFTYGAQLGHDYQNLVDTENLEKNRVSAATCTAAAVYNKSCARCGNVSAETFEYGTKSGHEMTKTDAAPATCTDDGNVEYYTCSNCSKNFSDVEGTTELKKVIIDRLGHDVVIVDAKDATCEEDGNKKYTKCSRCPETSFNADTVIPATGHKFDGDYVCDTVYNYHSKKCVNTDCGEIGILVDGKHVKYTVEYDGLDFVITGGEQCNFANYVASTAEGIHSHKLTCVCGNETAKAYSDEETFVKTVDKTCTVDGYDLYMCPDADCDATWTKNIVAAEGHKYGAKTQNTDGTTHSAKCTVCGEVDKSSIGNCTGGTATCSSEAICEVCNSKYGSKGKHSLAADGWTSDNNATCTADGTESQACSICGETQTRTEVDSKLPHTMSGDTYDVAAWKFAPDGFDASEIKAPTCGAEGRSINYCANCEYHKTKVVSKVSDAHQWPKDVDGEEDWDEIGGDCSTGVTSTITCTICGTTKTKTEKKDHTWNVESIVEAGCVENGYITFNCSTCNFTGIFDEKSLGWADGKFEDVEIVDDEGKVYLKDGKVLALKDVTDSTDATAYVVTANGAHDWIDYKGEVKWNEYDDDVRGAYAVIEVDGENVIVYVNADKHIVYIDKHASYTAAGRGTTKCEICKATEDVVIPANTRIEEDGYKYGKHVHPELIEEIKEDGEIVYKSTMKKVARVEPTCTSAGHEEYYECMSCPYSEYMEHHDELYIEAIDHEDLNGNGKCDSCSKDLEVDPTTKDCKCSCHKGGFIFKIVRFFWRIFGIKQKCSCGVVHY